MTYKTTTLNDFVGTSTPTFVGTTQIDGYVKGRPVVLRRLKNGTPMPSVGTTLPTSMGMGRVRGSMDGNLLVDIVSFNEDYMWENADGSDIFDASEKVAMLNSCLQRSLESIVADYTRIYKSDVTGVLSPNRQARLLSYLPEITDRTLSMSFSPSAITGSTEIIYKDVVNPKLSPSELRKQRALEIAEIQRVADAMLDDEVVPTDVQDELNEMFGEDGEF